MADLITPNELALWTGNDPDEVAADPFATEVLDKVSKLVRFIGGHAEWEVGAADPDDEVPFDVQMIALKVSKRVYENPSQVVQEGNVGPIGGDRVLDVAALLYDLTEAERATLVKYNGEGDPDAIKIELWVQPTTRGGPDLVSEKILFVSDDQQINFTADDSAWPPWDIPMFSPGDPGDPSHYED